MDPKTVKTLYEIVVLGSSAQSNEPSFFTETKYAAEVAKWRTARQLLNNRSFLIDEIFAIFLEMLGMNALVANEAAIEALWRERAADEWSAVDEQRGSADFVATLGARDS